MRKSIFLFFCFIQCFTLLYAQVGINTDSPKATLDILSSSNTDSPDGLLVPRLTLSELISKNGSYGKDQDGTLIYITQLDASNASMPTVTATGFYFYDSKLDQWQPFASGGSSTSTNIYNADGSLTSNRTVDLNSKNLVFSNTGNVGIGTTTPTNKLDIAGANPLRLQQLSTGAESTDKLLVVDNTGVVKNVGTVNDVVRNIYNTDGSLTSNRTVDLNSKNLVFSNTGNVGIGTTTPTNKLDIAGANPLRLQQLSTGSEDNDKLLVVDNNGVVKNVGTQADMISNFGIPAPALFVLKNDITNFLSTANMGSLQTIPMSLLKDEINGLSLSSDGTEITFPPGVYLISLTYEALHDTDGTISSYFVDFPVDGGDTRVHSTAAHDTGVFSNHGGTINYVTSLSTTTKWKIQLGRGQSGNCMGAGMTLYGGSTQLLIYRMGK